MKMNSRNVVRKSAIALLAGAATLAVGIVRHETGVGSIPVNATPAEVQAARIDTAITLTAAGSGLALLGLGGIGLATEPRYLAYRARRLAGLTR